MIAALILAAGTSSRMKGIKQLLEVGDETMLQRVVDTALGSQADEVVVVLGYRSDEIRERIRFRSAKVVFSRDYMKGMSASLRSGLGALRDDVEAVVVLLADQPLVPPGVVDALIEVYKRSRKRIVIPVSEGVRRNPVLMELTLRGEILEVEGDVGAKPVIDRHKDEIAEVEIPNASFFADVDTWKD
ncbi:MAG: NTP transferase domain-containing protein, partial [Candidatus Geothermarchaeales archaeon]